MRINELTPSEAEHVLKKLTELTKTDGWVMLKKIMASEREDFFRKTASPTNSTGRDLFDYNRGIIEGTYRLESLPDNAIKVLEGAVKLAKMIEASKLSADQQPKPPEHKPLITQPE